MSLHNTSLHYTIRLCVLQQCGRGGHRVVLDTSQPSVTGGSGTMIAGVCHPAWAGGAFGTDFVFFISCRQKTHNPVKGQEDNMLEVVTGWNLHLYISEYFGMTCAKLDENNAHAKLAKIRRDTHYRIYVLVIWQLAWLITNSSGTELFYQLDWFAGNPSWWH